jgi:hypothetical protein
MYEGLATKEMLQKRWRKDAEYEVRVPSDQSPTLFHRVAHSTGTCRTHTRGVKA